MPTAATARRSTPATRTILIVLQDGSEMLVGDIPANAKVTFGALQPGRDGGYGTNTAVRIYTAANNQLAVFRNAASFRDLTLSVQVKQMTIVEDSETVAGPSGKKHKTNYELSSDWVAMPAIPVFK